MADDKLCTKCGKELPLTEFGINKQGQNGLRAACKACSNKYTRSLNRQIRELVLNHYGHACVCCGEMKNEFLGIDHIKGGGRKHRLETGMYGSAMYRWLLKKHFPPGYQLLCHNCNLAKGIYGRCPHETGIS